MEWGYMPGKQGLRNVKSQRLALFSYYFNLLLEKKYIFFVSRLTEFLFFYYFLYVCMYVCYVYIRFETKILCVALAVLKLAL